VKAFVLAGGLGTRLRSRFGDLPKPLVPLGGRPFLERQIEWLAGHGIRDIVLCVGHGADRVRAALEDGGPLGVTLQYSTEAEPLGTAGALRLAAPLLEGPALVVNGDTLLACDPWSLERARWERGVVGAVALFEVVDASARGRVECDAEGRVVQFVEKAPGPEGAAWVNGGLYAFDPGLWRWIPPEGPASLERDVLPQLARASQLHGHCVPGEFFDIGTPEQWERAEKRFTA
jgi:NDP-sugar pyrophosphorylase family protein